MQLNTNRINDRAGQGVSLPVLLFFLVISALVFISPNYATPLTDRREEHLAWDALNTWVNKSVLVVDDRGQYRLKKPPVARWLTTIPVVLAPQKNAFWVRLPGAVCAVLVTLLLVAAVSKMSGTLGGIVAGMAWMTTVLILTETWVATYEIMLALWSFLALLALSRAISLKMRALEVSTSPRSGLQKLWQHPSLWLWLTGCCVGLGVLTKGPISPGVMAMTILFYAFITWRWQHLLLLVSPSFWAGVLMMVLPWLIPTLLIYDEAVQVWFFEVSNKTVEMKRRAVPFIILLPTLSAPWTILAMVAAIMPAVLRIPKSVLPFKSLQELKRIQDASLSSPRSQLFYLSWALLVGNLVMFSFWARPIEPYFILCLPGLYIIIGATYALLARLRTRRHLRLGRAVMLVARAQCLVLVLTGPVFLVVMHLESHLELSPINWLDFILVVTALLGMLACVPLFLWWKNQLAFIVGLLGMSLALLVMGHLKIPEMIGENHYEGFVEVVQEKRGEERIGVWFTAELQDWTKPDVPHFTETLWYFMEPRPEILETDIDLVPALERGEIPQYYLMSPAQLEMYRAKPEIQLEVIHHHKRHASTEMYFVKMSPNN